MTFRQWFWRLAALLFLLFLLMTLVADEERRGFHCGHCAPADDGGLSGIPQDEPIERPLH